jgi:hypothetical protein
VPEKPQRPFVPHRTPKGSRPVAGPSEFRLGRPFVPGAFRDVPAAAETPLVQSVQPVARVADTPSTDRRQLPPIEVFLDNRASENEEMHELPPVEHFLDPMPSVGGFAPAAEGALMNDSALEVDYTSPPPNARPATESGWGVDDWQQYDWRAAATLGEGVDSQASNEWATTNWDVGTRTPRTQKKLSAAQAIASALDQIAQQIREGDLTIPSSGGSPTDPGAIAATLAALLGVKR